MAQWREFRIIDEVNPGTNPMVLCQAVDKVCSICIASVHPAVGCRYECFGIYRGGYFCKKNSLRILIAE